VKKRLGVVKFIDKKSGKRVWGWPGKVDYAAKAATPGAGNFAQQIANPVSNQRGQGPAGKIAGFVTGVKVDPADPQGVAIERLFNEKTRLEHQRAMLSQQGIGSSRSGKKETPAYKHLATRLAIVNNAITKQSAKRGDKKPLLQRSSGSGSTSSGGSDWRGKTAPSSGDWRTSP
jgi:hypothetical protein